MPKHLASRPSQKRASILPLVLFAALMRASLAWLREALSPASCAACDARIRGSRIFCSPCAATVLRAEPTDDGLIAFALFGGAVADAVRRFKYEERPDLARPLGHLLRRALREAPAFGGADLVVPVPLHPRKLVERGYNQAALLARFAASELHVPLAASALTRVRATAQQARLGKDDRQTNVVGAFTAKNPRLVRGKTILLVDDVATTGATLAACQEALLGAGAVDVVCVCLARAGHRD